MNNTIKLPQKSRVFLENPYDATGYHDRKIASPTEGKISKIKANFGKISQDKPNFAALVGFYPAQNPNTHQKTTATKARRGFTLCN